MRRLYAWNLTAPSGTLVSCLSSAGMPAPRACILRRAQRDRSGAPIGRVRKKWVLNQPDTREVAGRRFRLIAFSMDIAGTTMP